MTVHIGVFEAKTHFSELVERVSTTGEGVIITYAEGDHVTCTFTNSPVSPVGGVVLPANAFAVLGPWLAVIGLVGCIGTVAVVAKKHEN